MTPEIASELSRESGALEVARAYVVDSPDMAQLANEELRAIKVRIERVKQMKAGFVLPAKQIVSHAEALFDPPLEALAGAEVYLKEQLAGFRALEDRRAAEALRKRQEEERAARQEAERKAAAERARTEEIAREERKRAAELEAQRAAAEAEGNRKAAAKLAGEAAAAEERAKAAIENGEAKATQLELSASAALTTTEVPEPTVLDGFSMRDNWGAEIPPEYNEDQAKELVVAAIGAGRRDLLALVKLDMPSANKLAKALKGGFNVPGLRAVNRPVAASRK